MQSALRNLLLGTAAAVSLLAWSGVAHAGPTTTIDGITIPVGLIPGGDQIQTGIIEESLVGAPGDVLQGIGYVQAIDDSSNNPVWTDGTNGIRLAFTFTYTASVVTAPTSSTAGVVDFTGGVVDFYTEAAGYQLSGHGSQSADFAAVASSATHTWLTTKGGANDAAGNTLVSNLPANSSLTDFAAAGGNGWLDVSGGDAGSAYNTNTYTNAFDTTNDVSGTSDLLLTSSFSTGVSGDFPISGTENIKGNTIPEPATLAILGTGVIALGLFGRRRRRV